MIEAHRYDQATEMTYALSDFFRISLSKGHDWIPIEKELRHVDDYLKILQIRYGDMLSYTIENQVRNPDVLILKMILQPLIENAVYHGTKFVRRVGKISVTVTELPTWVQMTVTDNGAGIDSERLTEIQKNLRQNSDPDPSSGYGLYNVYRRLLLNYGSEAQMTINSQHMRGTQVTISVPKKEESSHV